MWFELIVALALVSIMPFWILMELMAYFKGDDGYLKNGTRRVVEFITVILVPWIFLIITESRSEIDCCDNSVLFAPDYRNAVFVWIGFL
jgi:hypothetical protein